MATQGLSVQNYSAPSVRVTGGSGSNTGSTYNPQQGSTAPIQGSSPRLQGSSPGLQVTANPQTAPLRFGAPASPASTFDIQKYLADAMASIRPPAPVYAPKYDIAAANATARATAEQNVNPYYTSELNKFIQKQAVDKTNTEKQTQMNIQNIADQAKSIQDANAVTGTRTTEDAAAKQADINQVADWRQTDQAGQYDMNRVAEAIDQAKSGTTGSGIAAGQSDASRSKFTTTESRQATADQQKRDLTELGKARTFEDLATSNTNAATNKQKGTEQANFDLSKFIQGQGFALDEQKTQLEKLRLEQVAAETGNQNSILFSKYLQGISNPAQYNAALSTYGRLI